VLCAQRNSIPHHLSFAIHRKTCRGRDTGPAQFGDPKKKKREEETCCERHSRRADTAALGQLHQKLRSTADWRALLFEKVSESRRSERLLCRQISLFSSLCLSHALPKRDVGTVITKEITVEIRKHSQYLPPSTPSCRLTEYSLRTQKRAEFPSARLTDNGPTPTLHNEPPVDQAVFLCIQDQYSQITLLPRILYRLDLCCNRAFIISPRFSALLHFFKHRQTLLFLASSRPAPKPLKFSFFYPSSRARH
jgi:hypothetical protein